MNMLSLLRQSDECSALSASITNPLFVPIRVHSWFHPLRFLDGCHSLGNGLEIITQLSTFNSQLRS